MFRRNKYKEQIKKAQETGSLSLNRLDLTDMPLKQMSNIKAELKIIDISRNLLTDVPHGLAEFKFITHLNISYNNLDEVPAPVAELRSLEVLRMYNNHIKELPLFLTKLQSLEILNMYENQLRSIPEEFSRMMALKEISIGCNYIDISSELICDALFAKLSGTNDQFIPSKILDKVYLGSYSASKNLEGLKERGITHVLIAASGLDSHFPSDLRYKTEDIQKHFKESHDFIDEAVNAGGGVLIHCAAGISRSGAVTISYVMKTKKLTVKEAEEIVLKARPVVSPNEGFQKQLLQFEEFLTKHK